VLKHLHGKFEVLAARVVASPQEVVVGLKILRRLLCDGLFFLWRERDAKRLSDAARNVILHFEHVLHFAVVAVGPDAVAGSRLDELNRDAQPIARAADAASEYIGGVQLLSHLRPCSRFVSIRQHRRTREYLKRLDLGQFGDHVFGHAVTEVLVLFRPAEVFKVKNSHGFFRAAGHLVSWTDAGCGFRSNCPAGRIKISFQSLQVGLQLPGSLTAHIAVFLKCLINDFFQLKWKLAVELNRRFRIFVQNGIENRG